MRSQHPVSRRRRLIARTTVGLIIVVTIADGALILLHDSATPVSVDDAIAQYRSRLAVTASTNGLASTPTTPTASAGPASTSSASTTELVAAGADPVDPTEPTSTGTTPPADPARLPAPGVYRYDTTGYEEVGVPGSRRSFPDETTITVTPTDCGVAETWRPFQEHVEYNDVCTAGTATRLAGFGSSISFYGQTDTEHFACDPSATFGPAATSPGQSWTFDCTTGSTTATSQAALLGEETFDIDNVTVDTIHVRVETTFSGDQRGTSTNDYWFATTNALLVKNTGSVHAHSSGSFGSTDYTETYGLLLTSTLPQR